MMDDAVQAMDHAMLARGNILPRLLDLSTSPQASCTPLTLLCRVCRR